MLTALESSIRWLHRGVTISTRSNIHELFDANKYGALLPLPEFTFEFKDPKGNLEFLFHLGKDFWNNRTEEKLQGRVLSCEPWERERRSGPVTQLPRDWRIKVSFAVVVTRLEGRLTRMSSEDVSTYLLYDSVTKKAKLEDDQFHRKFLLWLDPEEHVLGGVYFNGRQIARQVQPKIPTEADRNLPIEELKLGVRAYNALKRMGKETVGDVADISEDELAQIPNLGRVSVDEIKQALQEFGFEPKK